MLERLPHERDQRMQLDGLWADIVQARDDVAAERLQTRQHTEPSARVSLILALEAYLGTIAACGYPAPYLLTNELRLQRNALRLCRGCTSRVEGAS